MPRDVDPMSPDAMAAEDAALPPRGAVDDGKTGGILHRGEAGDGNFRGHAAAGHNAQTGVPSGTEAERTAPGISTDKKADDTK